MILRRRIRDWRVLYSMSMWFLVLFNLMNFVARRFLAPAPGSLADGLIDGAAGACLGIALMTLFFAFRMKNRGTQTPCA